MKIIKLIDEIFSVKENMETVSIHRSDVDILKNKYYVCLTLGKRYDDNYIYGYVRTDYSCKPPKYICDHVSDYQKVEFIDKETSKKLLEYAHEISMNSSAIDGYSIEIIKRDNDYSIEIPEMEIKHYRAGRYFEEREIEEEEETVL